MAVVIPAPGEISSTARQLLDLAGHPREVRTIGNGTEFEVPDELADAYIALSAAPAEGKTTERKRRGRPPRINTEE